MKITGFETIPIQGRAMVLKMFTDAGINGAVRDETFRLRGMFWHSDDGAFADF